MRRSFHTKVNVAARARALACAGLLLFAPGAAALADEKGTQDFGDHMEEMPWYNQPGDTYKEYTPEEVRKHIPDEDEQNPGLRMRPSGPLIPAGAQEFLLIIFLGILVFFCAFLGYRWWMEREPGLPRTIRKPRTAPEVLDLPGLEETVSSEVDLKTAILASLQQGQERTAAGYIFAFFLLELSARELLELRRDRTAREYSRTVARNDEIPLTLRDLFKQVATVFEIAVYGESSPGVDLKRLWERVAAALEIPGGARVQ